MLALNDLRVRLRPRKVMPENVLLLIPHCLQRKDCDHNIVSDLDRCERCGRCDIAALIALREEFGVECHVVGGGREATRRAKEPDVRAILAVACAKELTEGIRAVFPKYVVAVANQTPEGPCRNTRVDIEAVRSALRDMINRRTPAADRMTR